MSFPGRREPLTPTPRQIDSVHRFQAPLIPSRVAGRGRRKTGKCDILSHYRIDNRRILQGTPLLYNATNWIPAYAGMAFKTDNY